LDIISRALYTLLDKDIPKIDEALAKVHYPLTLALSHQGRGLINKPLP
jgi:hypothetical protein